jgi:transcriptional regulator with XRE-family HTH domain
MVRRNHARISTEATDADVAKNNVLDAVGKNLRTLRRTRNLTLQALSERTGLSISMLSLLERGKASPSVGTLVVVSSELGVPISELLGSPPQEGEIITRYANQSVVTTREGVVHRVVTNDQSRGLEITLNQYGSGTANSAEPIAHAGFEYGLVLDGSLEVIVNGTAYSLGAGDLISYQSTQPHRIVNTGEQSASALWINLRAR